MTFRLILPVLLLASLGTAFGAALDFEQAHRETLANLKSLVRIDTSNPPGNETQAANFLRDLLAKEGIDSEILEKVPGRGNLIARLKGNGKKQPLLLMAHTDVVGVERDKWTVDPFAAEEKDGYLYGRGASDDKGMLAVCLQVFVMLKRLQTPLDRDIIFLAEAGEESTTEVGIDFLVEKHLDKIQAEFGLNEGGTIRREKGELTFFGVATTEKTPRTVMLSAKGVSAHGSMPRVDNPIVHLAKAIAKFDTWQPPVRLNETTRTYFERLASISDPGDAWLYRNIQDPQYGASVQEILRVKSPSLNSMLRTSISPTIIKGGFRTNVIPGDAMATLDVRALPDEDMAAFTEMLNRVIDDPAITVIRPSAKGRPVGPPSPLDSEMFMALERAQKTLAPKAVTLPMMMTGASDSAQMRAAGVKMYGVGAVSPVEGNNIHGNDERIEIAGIRTFLEYLWLAVNDVAAAK